MTEEQTYIKLRKPPIKDMISMVNDIPDPEWNAMTDEEKDAFFEFWCWSYHEYAVLSILYNKGL